MMLTRKLQESLRFSRVFTVLIFVLLMMIGNSFSVFAKQSKKQCFTEVDYCIEGRLLEYWLQNGGLPVFGYPISPQFEDRIERETVQVQWFERARLELHPQGLPPYDVLLGRLGVEVLKNYGDDWKPSDSPQKKAGCRFFVETGYNICGKFLRAWREYGLELDGIAGKSEVENLALFGYPISEPRFERLGDGKLYLVQWFERTRFEEHGGEIYPYDVLFGLLGSELLANEVPTPTISVAPTASLTPISTLTPTRRPRPRPSEVPESTPTSTSIPYPQPPNPALTPLPTRIPYPIP